MGHRVRIVDYASETLHPSHEFAEEDTRQYFDHGNVDEDEDADGDHDQNNDLEEQTPLLPVFTSQQLGMLTIIVATPGTPC